MRTTLTLEDDIVARIERLCRQRNASLEQVVNDALRLGLDHMESPEPPAEPYRTRSASLGRCLLPDLDNVAEVLASAEGERHR